MSHIPLPDEDVVVPAPRRGVTTKVEAKDQVPRRSYQKLGDFYVYVVQLRLAPANLPGQPERPVAGIIHLCHQDLFSEDELAAMIVEAAKVVNEVRLPNRRQSMRGQKVGVDPVVLNEQWFPVDADFLEAVMCDKFDFRKVQVTMAVEEIEVKLTFRYSAPPCGG